jgi:Leucine-rich repeat (LRR) protein
LKKLKYLYLHDNELSRLPDTIAQFSDLEELLVADNQLTSLPESFAKLKKLRSLELYGNKFSKHEKETKVSRYEF